MAKIGTWKKSLEGDEYFKFENSNQLIVTIFHAEKLSKKPIWAVEFRDEKKKLFIGRTNKTSKANAFRVARAYMKKHLGKKENRGRK